MILTSISSVTTVDLFAVTMVLEHFCRLTEGGRLFINGFPMAENDAPESLRPLVSIL